MDLVFPTCRSFSSGSGIGTDCAINIAYNKQKPLCPDPAQNWLKAAGQAVVGKKQDCRKHTELCTPDEGFGFDLNPLGDVSLNARATVALPLISQPQSFTSIKLEDIFDGTNTLQFAQPTTSSQETSIPIPLRIGDYNVDGFPDVLTLLVNATAKPAPGGLFGGSRGEGVQVKLLESIPCGKKTKGCDNKVATKRRSFRVVKGKEVAALETIWDARSVSWLDIDEDVSRIEVI
jgi:integrin alpha FG-GAP repeat containing protein 1